MCCLLLPTWVYNVERMDPGSSWRHTVKGQVATRETPVRQKEKLLHPGGGQMPEQGHGEAHVRL